MSGLIDLIDTTRPASAKLMDVQITSDTAAGVVTIAYGEHIHEGYAEFSRVNGEWKIDALEGIPAF